ncbi:MAG TPA: CrcB family protein [Candidatus Corynebacterium avicola]|uniref:Fluoride-specific ion channel FluC n=1 Tax=Candidatus Corynebacterium avicola TaxID=2838527 RepID=A0A9D1UM15_9CORY|nr:CrcB family protein [Candidatus Corynebacterium avicola]
MTGEISLVAALLVAFGGGSGAWLRWRLDRFIKDHSKSDLLVSLLVINTLGSLALGVLFGLTDSWWLVALIGTGLCGGFTTFSTASVDAVGLFQRKLTVAAVVSVVAMALLAVAAFALGHAAVSWI